jgi:hypothetical protein
MKRLFLGLMLAAVASLSISASASAAEFETLVGCDDLAEIPVPAHVCQVGDSPGAYFESDVDTEYEVCVEFPDAAFFCAEEEEAEAGVLYVNPITSGLEGNHLVSWYVEGEEVGSWAFRLDPPPPPPSPPPPPPSPPAPAPVTAPLPAVASGPSAECLKARRRVDKLKGRLRKAAGIRQKTPIRGKLRSARATEKRVC